MKTFVDEVNKKIDLGTLVECISEERTFIKSNPHHYSLTTMVSFSTSTTTADCIINHTNTMVPNEVTSLSNEQICIDNPLNNQVDVMQAFALYNYPLCLDISKAYL